MNKKQWFIMIILGIILVVTFWSLPAHSSEAGDIRLTVNITSAHMIAAPQNLENGWNADNFGIGGEYHLTENTYAGLGGYYNSFREDSIYATLGYEFAHFRMLEQPAVFGLEGGPVTGYDEWQDEFKLIMVGDAAILGGAFVRVGETNQVKTILSVGFVGVQYLRAFE